MIHRLFWGSLVVVLCTLAALPSRAQNGASLQIGDPAPTLSVRKWFKGEPLISFEKGKVFVVEFWATWCKPCIAGMPHLSQLAQTYKGRVLVAGISILERKGITDERLSTFVDSMGQKMAYTVGAEEGNLMATNWLKAAGERGIPNAFVVDGQGRIAWIGPPRQLDKVLPEIVAGRWNREAAAKARLELQRLTALDNEVISRLNPFMGNPGNPAGALVEIQKILTEHPGLKYYPYVGHYTFYSLLKTDPLKSLEFAKAWLGASTEPKWKTITDAISYEAETGKRELPKELYELAAASFEAQLENYPWSMDAVDTHRWIARLEYLAGNKGKAVEAQQKAVDAARNKKDRSAEQLSHLEETLKKYKNS